MAYWDDDEQAIVITNPDDPDGGTAFKPGRGKAYFDMGTSDIPHTSVPTLEDLFDDAHLQAVGFFPEFDHPSEGRLRTTAIPSQWSASQPSVRRHAPRLGADSQAILQELGYSAIEIQALVEAGTTKLEA